LWRYHWLKYPGAFQDISCPAGFNIRVLFKIFLAQYQRIVSGEVFYLVRRHVLSGIIDMVTALPEGQAFDQEGTFPVSASGHTIAGLLINFQYIVAINPISLHGKTQASFVQFGLGSG
jgi:hypothetical protein